MTGRGSGRAPSRAGGGRPAEPTGVGQGRGGGRPPGLPGGCEPEPSAFALPSLRPGPPGFYRRTHWPLGPPLLSVLCPLSLGVQCGPPPDFLPERSWSGRGGGGLGGEGLRRGARVSPAQDGAVQTEGLFLGSLRVDRTVACTPAPERPAWGATTSFPTWGPRREDGKRLAQSRTRGGWWGGHLDFLSLSWEKAGGGAVSSADQRKCPGAL